LLILSVVWVYWLCCEKKSLPTFSVEQAYVYIIIIVDFYSVILTRRAKIS
jgi:hypothetical protein